MGLKDYNSLDTISIAQESQDDMRYENRPSCITVETKIIRFRFVLHIIFEWIWHGVNFSFFSLFRFLRWRSEPFGVVLWRDHTLTHQRM